MIGRKVSVMGNSTSCSMPCSSSTCLANSNGESIAITVAEVVIVLANRNPELTARAADVISLQRHLVDKGVVDQSEFERLLPCSP